MLTKKNKIVRFSSSFCVAFILICTIALSACAPAAAPTATIDAKATSDAAFQLTAAAIKAEANLTATAEKLSQQQQLTSAAQTATAQVTNTPTALPTSTPIPTQTPDLAATQQVTDMADRAQRYVKDGSLPKGTGKYIALPDYDTNLSRIGYWVDTKTDYSPVNFVVEADMEWDSASSISNWDLSGCGFSFRDNEDANEEYMVFLSLYGNVRSYALYKGYLQPMGTGYFGKLDIPKGKAHLAVAMNGDSYTVYVNDKLVKKFTGFANQLSTGSLAYSLVSGTNTDFGTRCTWSNAVLWEVTQ